MSTSLRRALRRAALEAWLADADAVLATVGPTAVNESRPDRAPLARDGNRPTTSGPGSARPAAATGGR